MTEGVKVLWGDNREKARKRYEYKCPWCGKVNVRYEETQRLICDRCGKTFYPW